MIPYQNINLLSPIVSFDYGDDWICLEWFSGEMRTFRYNEAGKRHVDQMIKCAKKGKGLSTYIEKNRRNFEPDKKNKKRFLFFRNKGF
ncbi:hypothetical protein FGF66_01290 [Chlorobaculum thiosulfatiphilum]|jgi:hypothetical protein|uniref:KTSC domain-containing protein n=1 Tax=Chlorobaculum thiosulfatiphilum TaxID=115852 RepID=A0A5C4SA35_CHLTI|nr:hypothetical protein [Chlorobaculum thiosulfatiphilum]TNJ40413.1 hypothetical protein FGF66_01290 [Chlorobaculum thiosulfatiphilum]